MGGKKKLYSKGEKPAADGVYIRRLSKTATTDQQFERKTSTASDQTRLSDVSRSKYHDDLRPAIKHKLTKKLAFATFIIVLGSSYQFGYNIGVLNNPSQLIQDFYRESYDIRTDLVLFLWSFTTACFFIPGGMVGAFVGGGIADKVGRKKGILISHVFVLAGSIAGTICVTVNSPVLLVIARVLFGIHAGIGNCLAPMMLTEIAPYNLRGAIGTVHQLAITFGIFMSSVYGLDSILGTQDRWQYLLLLEAFPAIISLCVLPFLPDSPRYLLLLTKRRDKAKKALQFYRETYDVSHDMEEMDTESKQSKSDKKKDEVYTVRQFFADKTLRRPLFIACFLQVIQQFSGINAIFFYSTSIFKASGVAAHMVPYAAMGTNAVNFAMTLVSVYIMDKAGRRVLLLIPMMVMILDLALLAFAQIMQSQYKSLSYVSVVCVILYVICFSVGLGPIPTTIASEIFRQGPRPIAMASAGVANWVFTFIIAISFESIQRVTKEYTFLIFLALMILFTIYVYFNVPETKNKTIEQIAHEFAPGEIVKVEEAIITKSPVQDPKEGTGTRTSTTI